jgi:alanyl-tRNA synthetase
MRTVNDIRKLFLEFFEKEGHSVVPSSSLVPANDPTLMFTNAGMVPFKHVFSGAESINDKAGKQIIRATSSQKCVRAGGKHNDLDNVGYTARHHTFFEMLGNFSFADYFKEEAIYFAWKLLTESYALPKEKLFITVYHTDDEAFDLWKKVTGFADERILRVPTKDNFWAMGDTGPCGPCSEIFYDHGEGIEGEWKLNSDGSDRFGERYVEIWNLVFMQFEALAGGKQIDLPKPCIDTGMGLERMATVMQGVHNNYDTDLFQHLIQASQDASNNADEALLSSHRIIADHLRSTSFLIADGVTPSNEGRGYVLRRIMRRAMRHAHILGCKEPLIHKLVPALITEMGAQYNELGRAEALITETLKSEEERFKETLERGLKLLDEATENLSTGSKLPGKVAFKLYDTFGFPVDLTADILRGQNLELDEAGFKAAMDEQKAKARAAWSGSGAKATDDVWFDIKEQHGATEFLGYETLHGNGQVIALVKDGAPIDSAQKGDEITLLTNQTSFYGESGGQAGDTGSITAEGLSMKVTNTQKFLGDIIAHVGKITEGSVATGDVVTLDVDAGRRDALRANHSATHLLHAVLRNNLGDHVTQKGSLVEDDKLRFDFSHSKALSSEELATVEQEVNRLINENTDVSTQVMAPDEAIEKGAMALFGEKYGDEVRVLSMGLGEGEKPYSVELCGGTHVKKTGEIQKFKIIKESSAASGIRRIEAKTAASVDAYLKEQEEAAKQEAQRKKEAQNAAASQASAASEVRKVFLEGIKNAKEVNGVTFYGQTLEEFPPKDLRGLVDDFKKQAGSGVVTIIATSEGKASIVVGVTDDLTANISAADLVKIGSEALGGKGGGGRPDMAQAGGPNPERAGHAIEAIKSKL